MAEIKPLNKIAKKWSEVAARSSDEYADGVQNPRRPWEGSTIAADQARRDGLAEADARDAFTKGVAKAGEEKWKSRATKLGPRRYSEGVRIAEPEFQKGFAPFHSAIQGVTLPPRGPKGSPENIERVRAIAEALHNEKISG